MPRAKARGRASRAQLSHACARATPTSARAARAADATDAGLKKTMVHGLFQGILAKQDPKPEALATMGGGKWLGAKQLGAQPASLFQPSNIHQTCAAPLPRRARPVHAWRARESTASARAPSRRPTGRTLAPTDRPRPRADRPAAPSRVPAPSR